MPLLVSFNFPVKVFCSLPYYTVLLTVSDEIAAKIISSIMNRGRKKDYSCWQLHEFFCPTDNILITYVFRRKPFAPKESRCCILTNKKRKSRLHLGTQNAGIHLSGCGDRKTSVCKFCTLLVLVPWKGDRMEVPERSQEAVSSFQGWTDSKDNFQLPVTLLFPSPQLIQQPQRIFSRRAGITRRVKPRGGWKRRTV